MLSSEEIRRCGGVRAAREVRRACRKLTTLFGWREDPPSPVFHAVNGELGLFVWDGSGYRFECYIVDEEDSESSERRDGR